MGARIIDSLGIMAHVTNIEPSTTIHDVPRLLHVKYIPMQISLKDALDVRMPYPADCLLLVSAAHEIALCNNSSASKNKEISRFRWRIEKKKANKTQLLVALKYPELPLHNNDAKLVSCQHQSVGL